MFWCANQDSAGSNLALFFNREFVWEYDGRFVNFQHLHVVAKGPTALPNSDKAYRRC